jgi:PPM family protein phosphatase
VSEEPERPGSEPPPATAAPAAPPAVEPWFEIGACTDRGTRRPHNEDHCGYMLLGAATAIVAVADGVSGLEGGQTASGKAVEVTLRAFTEQPPSKNAARRLAEAAQQANIEVYDLSVVVPELRGMATTLTAVALDRGELHAAHVGDSRLYLVRGGSITQLTKDHTVTAERHRMGLLSAERARTHPDRSTLTRFLGRELIVAMDRLSRRVFRDDVLVVCSDGLYNALDDESIAAVARGVDADAASHALIDAANARGTDDNLTAVVIRVRGPAGEPPPRVGLRERLRHMAGRR